MVGGVAAVGYGAERPTEDADCVVRRERTNFDRLAGALRELHARLRGGGMTDAEARTFDLDDRRGPFRCDVLARSGGPDRRRSKGGGRRVRIVTDAAGPVPRFRRSHFCSDRLIRCTVVF
jgi:hypothetical protein